MSQLSRNVAVYTVFCSLVVSSVNHKDTYDVPLMFLFKSPESLWFQSVSIHVPMCISGEMKPLASNLWEICQGLL